MKAIIAVIAAGLFSVNAFAQSQIETLNTVVCTASTYQNEATLPLPSVKNVQVYVLDPVGGDIMDAGIVGGPFALTQTSVFAGFSGESIVNYTVDGTSLEASITYVNGDVTAVQVGVDEFSAPTLVKDQKVTDDIVANGGAGFTCSGGSVAIKAPTPGLARPD